VGRRCPDTAAASERSCESFLVEPVPTHPRLFNVGKCLIRLSKSYGSEILYTIRLGQPVGATHVEDNIIYRHFEKGFVVVNVNSSQSNASIKNITNTSYTDLFSDSLVKEDHGALMITLPPSSGRAYIMGDLD
jgi:hypothetical protein